MILLKKEDDEIRIKRRESQEERGEETSGIIDNYFLLTNSINQ